MEKKQRILFTICVIYCVWHLGTQWTSTLLSFLQWDTVPVMSIIDLGYIQSFGSLCNAIGALLFGQVYAFDSEIYLVSLFQLADSTGAKAMFIISTLITSIYFSGLSLAQSWYSFLFLQILRVGYQLDATAEMYLATVTTERERTQSIMLLTIPQAMALFFGPMMGAKVAAFTSLRQSQFIVGIAMATLLIPIIWRLLPETHSVPKLASARLRPQDYWPMIRRNAALFEGLLLRSMIVASYVCYELVSRNFLMKAFMKGPNDNALVLGVMGLSLVIVQLFILPMLQRQCRPKMILQLSLVTLVVGYFSALFCTSFEQLLIMTGIQTGAYAMAYALASTQITTSVETGDMGKATGLASMAGWMVHFIIPIYTSHLVYSWHYTYAFYTSSIASALTLAYVTFVAKHGNSHQQNILPAFSTI